MDAAAARVSERYCHPSRPTQATTTTSRRQNEASSINNLYGHVLALLSCPRHCLDCHDSETREGKVDLETLSFRITTIEQAELWQKVLNALNAGEMPPEDSEQPGNTEKADFLDDLARTMVTARQALSDSGGKITMRRLNRREYRNTIEQLTGVKVDVGLTAHRWRLGNL